MLQELVEGAKEAAPAPKRKRPRLKSISHVEDPARPGYSMCGLRLKGAAGVSDPCVVCISMKTYGRFAAR